MSLKNVLRNPYPVVLVLLALFLSWVNFQPGTWLSGWDTLHPELNFGLYFKRLIFGAWQEIQGLGSMASQAHAAELPRLLLYYPFSLVLPDSFLRYAYFFLTLIFGPLGTYFLLEHINLKRPAAFAGASLYLLNLGTLQHYYLPLEMFATHFATLPWLFLLATQYLETGKKKSLWLFAGLTIFAASMAHTSTLFFVYLLGLALYLGTLALFSWKNSWPRLLSIFLLTLLLNSFWLLPNLYFIKNHGEEVSLSKINTQFSEKAFLTSQKFGTLSDTAFLKNFLFDWGEYNEQQRRFVNVFDEWTPHLNNPINQAIGYSVFLLVLLGILVALRQKLKYGLTFLPLAIITFLLIANDLPVTSYIFGFLQNSIPLFKEALRFPFTKFSILLMLAYAVYFGLALNVLAQLLNKHWKISNLVLSIIATILLAYFMFPAFQGNLLSPSMKVKFPEEYSQTLNWFAKQKKDGRVAHFPIHTFWGWVYYGWGYEGAGFWWFGLNQPFLDREFDRWSAFNENYYWEASYAVYSHNLDLLEKVFEKYQVRWLILDGNVISPSSPKSLAFEELNNLLSDSSKISLIQTFGKIKIYEVNLKTPVKDFVFLAQNLPRIEPTYKWNSYDLAYLENDNYLSLPASNFQLLISSYYPFRSLFTGRKQEELEFAIEDKGDYFLFKKVLPPEVKNYYLAIPEVKKKDLALIDPNNLNFIRYANPEVFFNGEVIEVTIPKISGYLSAKINPSQSNIENCNSTKTGTIKNEIIQQNGESVLQLQALNANNCSASFWLPNLPHKIGYLITAQSRHRSGQPLLFWLENLNSRKADLETYLPAGRQVLPQTSYYFIQPPMESDGLGYTLHFDNISIGRQPTINELGEVTLNPIPYSFLTELSLRNTKRQSPPQTFKLEVAHPNPSLYKVTIEQPALNNSVLVLSQSFEPGWLAYQSDNNIFPFFGKKINSHVLVNNWANGWVLDTDSSGKIILVFWPQYLEYLGFGLMGLTLLILLKFLLNQS